MLNNISLHVLCSLVSVVLFHWFLIMLEKYSKSDFMTWEPGLNKEDTIVTSPSLKDEDSASVIHLLILSETKSRTIRRKTRWSTPFKYILPLFFFYCCH
jgi:hypothetical protein